MFSHIWDEYTATSSPSDEFIWNPSINCKQQVITCMARLPYRYCSKNVSGYKRHHRSVVAYSAEVGASCSTDTVVFRLVWLNEQGHKSNEIGSNSPDKLSHTGSVAYLVEIVLLNKHQILDGGAYLDCYQMGSIN